MECLVFDDVFSKWVFVFLIFDILRSVLVFDNNLEDMIMKKQRKSL